MCVSIDQTRRDDFARCKDFLTRRITSFDVSAWANRDDATLRHGDAAIVDHTTRLVHRHDSATEYEQIN
jgi:hypothetical protein